MDEKKISDQIKMYQEAAKENPKIDVAALMMSAMQDQPENSISKAQKRWAYLTSIGIPPLGLFFALKFYFMDRDKSDFKKVFWTTVVVNIALTVAVVWFFQAAFYSVPGAKNITSQQLQSLPNQYEQLLQ